MSVATAQLLPFISVERNLISDNYFVHNRVGFDAYYNHYYQRLLSHSLRVTHDHEQSSTIVNDILMKLGGVTPIGKLAKPYVYDPSGSHLSYLMTAVWRKSVNHNKSSVVRKTKFEASMISDEDMNPMERLQHQYGGFSQNEFGDDGIFADTEVNMKLAIGVYMLEQADDKVLTAAIMSQVDGNEDYGDILERFDEVKTRGAIKTRVCRFRSKLIKHLAGYQNWKDVADGEIVSGVFYRFAEKNGKAYLYQHGNLVNSAFDGFITTLDVNGNMVSKIKHENGLPVGVGRYYDGDEVIKTEKYGQNGYIQHIKSYKNGILSNHMEFEGQGVPVYECDYDEFGEPTFEQLS